MMRFLCFSDLHARLMGGIPDWNRVGDDGMTTELRRFVRSINFVIDIIRKEKPDVVVFLGDLFHSLHSINATVMVIVSRCVGDLYCVCGEVGSDFWVVPGNHDVRGVGIYTSEILKCDRFFNSPAKVKIGGNIVGVLPYKDPEDAMASQLYKLSSSCDFVFAHMTVRGADFGKKVSEFGVDSSFLVSPVISGHIHIPQSVGNVTYVGSTYQILPREKDRKGENGVLLYDSKKNSIRRIINGRVSGISVVNCRWRSKFDKIEEAVESGDYIKIIGTSSEVEEISDKLTNYSGRFMPVVVPDQTNAIDPELLPESSSVKDMIVDFFKENEYSFVDEIKEMLVDL